MYYSVYPLPFFFPLVIQFFIMNFWSIQPIFYRNINLLLQKYFTSLCYDKSLHQPPGGKLVEVTRAAEGRAMERRWPLDHRADRE